MGQGHMALPKGWGKPFRGFTLAELGHATLRDLSAPPFWASCFLLSFGQPFIGPAYWPHTSLDQIFYKKILNIKNKFLFFLKKILEVVYRPEFAQDHESGLRSDRGPVVLKKRSHLREKGGVLMLFKTTLHLEAKAQYSTTSGSSCLLNIAFRRRTRTSTSSWFACSSTRQAVFIFISCQCH